MNIPIGRFLFALIGIVLTATSQASFAQVSVPADSILLVNSGSTNTPRWEILIEQDGAATLSVLDTTNNYTLKPALLDQLNADLTAAKNSGLRDPGSCPKPVSFAERVRFQFQGWNSPDLTCPVGKNNAYTVLVADLNLVLEAIPVEAVIEDIRYPIYQHPANLPHCVTPDGRYTIEVSPVMDKIHFYVMVKDTTQKAYTGNGRPYAFYNTTGTSPFVGISSGIYSKQDPFQLTLADVNYAKDTDASIEAVFTDQSGDLPRIPPPAGISVKISYPHLICTRYYR